MAGHLNANRGATMNDETFLCWSCGQPRPSATRRLLRSRWRCEQCLAKVAEAKTKRNRIIALIDQFEKKIDDAETELDEANESGDLEERLAALLRLERLREVARRANRRYADQAALKKQDVASEG